MKHIVLFVHGFGVQKDDRGLFTDISLSLNPDVTPSLVNLNLIDGANNSLTVMPFSVQAKILHDRYYSLKSDNTDAEITVIAHSQGCIVAALAGIPTKKIILLSPPTRLDANRLVDYFSDRVGTIMDMDGESVMARRDGSKTIVGKEYWRELREANAEKLYAELISKSQVVIIFANQDEVLGADNNHEISGADVKYLDADHDFTGVARRKLIELLQETLL